MNKIRKSLAMLLTLCMLITLVPAAVLAEGNEGGTPTDTTVMLKVADTAENDEAERAEGAVYKTIGGALAKAQAGDTVQLQNDVEEDVTIGKDQTIVLDLNGKKLTNKGNHTIVNNGMLTVKDSQENGTVDNVTHGKAALFNDVGATAMLGGGAYTRSKENGKNSADAGGNSYYAILNHGTMTINKGVSVSQSGKYSSLMENGWQNGSDNTTKAASKLTINGGVFDGGLNTIKNDDYGELLINDGEFKNVSQAAFLNWNVAEVKGGAFVSDGSAILNGHIDEVMDQGRLTISGGTFTSENAVIARMNGSNSDGIGSITVTDGKFYSESQTFISGTLGTSSIKVSGGYYNADVSEYAAEGYVATAGQWTVDQKEYTYKVGVAPADKIVAATTNVSTVAAAVKDAKLAVTGVVDTKTAVTVTYQTANGTEGTIAISYADSQFTAVPEKVTVGATAYAVDLTGLSAKPENVDVAVGTPDVKGDKEIDETIINAVKDIETPGIEAAVTEALNDDGTVTASTGKVDQDKAKQALEAEGKTVSEGETVTVVVEPYMQVNVTAYQAATETTPALLELDVTPMYNVKATTASTTGDMSGENTVTIGEPQKLEVAVPVTITVPLPTGFPTDNLFVKHVKDNGKTYYYAATVENDSGSKATFTNPNGFSTFTLQADTRSGVIDFGELGIMTYTLADVGTDLPKASRTGYDFAGWKIGEKTYRTLTEELLTAVNGKTVVAEAQFSAYSSDFDDFGSTGTTTYKITVADTANGTVKLSTASASKGTAVTVTVTPNTGYKLDKLTAEDGDGKALTLTDKGEGKYTFTMPASKVTVTAAFVSESEWSNPFADVSTGDWYYDAVAYVNQHNIMNGTAATAFAPGSNLTRGMIAQVLYNLEQKPQGGTSVFTDVAADAWYVDAVNWAAGKNIVGGYGDGKFGPEDSVTREQMAAILYRYAQYKGYDTKATADLAAYTDVQSVSDWALAAMQWANASGLINGRTETTLVPGGTATRAEVASILMRFCENIAK